MTSIIKVNEIQDAGGNTILSSNGTGTFTSNLPSAVNTPAFEATLSANQSVSGNAWTKVQFNTETFDTNNCYDNSTNYRFTPTSSGKYFIYCTIYFLFTSGRDILLQARILKNGSDTNGTLERQNRIKTDDILSTTTHNIVNMNGSTDYLECYAFQYDYVGGASYNLRGNSSGRYFCNFGAYKLIGA